jgi:hypothetical protein
MAKMNPLPLLLGAGALFYFATKKKGGGADLEYMGTQEVPRVRTAEDAIAVQGRIDAINGPIQVVKIAVEPQFLNDDAKALVEVASAFVAQTPNTIGMLRVVGDTKSYVPALTDMEEKAGRKLVLPMLRAPVWEGIALTAAEKNLLAGMAGIEREIVPGDRNTMTTAGAIVMTNPAENEKAARDAFLKMMQRILDQMGLGDQFDLDAILEEEGLFMPTGTDDVEEAAQSAFVIGPLSPKTAQALNVLLHRDL